MRYGCVSPSPEMENMDHSDSESSDASFEIVSAEGIEDCLPTPPSFKPCIKFHDIFDVYPMDADVVARVSTSNDFKMSSDDKVVVVPLAWSSVDQAVCVSKLNGFYVRFDVNELPKAPADQFYQLCYCTAEGSVVGVSTPFFFREVHEEDLMEFQKEKNKEFWTFRSRFAVLTDLYWNAVKNNVTARPDEMSGSCSAVKDSRPDEMSQSCSAKKDFDTIGKSLIESCTANKDAETIDKSSNEISSSTQNSETSEESSAEDCSANKVSEIKDESSAENCTANGVSETTEKALAENCSVKDSESTEKASPETVNEKSEDPVQSQLPCVNQESTTGNQKVLENSTKKSDDDANPKSTDFKPTNYSSSTYEYDGVRRPYNGYVERCRSFGRWKVYEEDSYYNGDEFAARSRQIFEDSLRWKPSYVNREPTAGNQKVSENSKKKSNDNASPRLTDFKPTNYSTSNNGAARKSDDGYAKRYMDVGPWKLYVNDSFYDRKQDSEKIRQVAEPVADTTKTSRGSTFESKLFQLCTSHVNANLQTQQNLHRRLVEYNANKGTAIMGLTIFRTLPEPIIGRLVLEAMNKLPMGLLEKDQFLCEARRQSRYDELMRKNGGSVKMATTKHTPDPPASVCQTILSLTSRIETQALLVQDLKMQLANGSKSIETIKGEYLTYKKEMETRLKHCAKKYAKMCLKLRHHENDGSKNI